MSKLKELTEAVHRNAERQEFAKLMMSGKINPKLYAAYLKNQHPQYEILEVCSMPHGLFNGMTELRRAPSILDDFIELWGSDTENLPEILPVTQKYIDHIFKIRQDPNKLMAHIYVRYMGDLSGGQMIAKRIPGSGKMYQFENADKLKEMIRSKIDDSMAEEATICFEFAAQTFKEMMELVDYKDE